MISILPVFHYSCPESVALCHKAFRLRGPQLLVLCVLLLLVPLTAPGSTLAAKKVQVVLGVPEGLQAETISAMRSQLDSLVNLSISELPGSKPDTGPDSDKARESVIWDAGTAAILGVGRQGCQIAAGSHLSGPVLCVLLSSEAFAMLQEESDHPDLRAIVVDQPMSRQARVATSVYPELKRFSVLSANVDSDSDQPDIEHVPYRKGEALADQITQALVGRDALIATPDHQIFNRSTLRTVLLTAYGYAKPVIGYSRAYVKAGALISSYSSSVHAFRQVAELLPELLIDDHSHIENALTPRYFSIADNPSVARSLGLIKRRTFAMDASYSDDDFTS